MAIFLNPKIVSLTTLSPDVPEVLTKATFSGTRSLCLVFLLDVDEDFFLVAAKKSGVCEIVSCFLLFVC